jgi:hypothetical protein
MALASINAQKEEEKVNDARDEDLLDSPDTLACGMMGPNSLEASLTLVKSSQMLWHCCRGGR